MISKLHPGISLVCVGYVMGQVMTRCQKDVLDHLREEENLSRKENEVPKKAGAMVHGDLVVSGLEALPTL